MRGEKGVSGRRSQLNELGLLGENQDLQVAYGFSAATEEDGAGKVNNPLMMAVSVNLHAEVVFGNSRGAWNPGKGVPQGDLFGKH